MTRRNSGATAQVEVFTPPVKGEIETQLEFLSRLLGYTPEWIWNIRKFIGKPTWQRNKHWYSKQEQKELIYYYVAITAVWGLRMSRRSKVSIRHRRRSSRSCRADERGGAVECRNHRFCWSYPPRLDTDSVQISHCSYSCWNDRSDGGSDRIHCTDST